MRAAFLLPMIAVAFSASAVAAAKERPARSPVQIVAVVNSCGPQNPLYKIVGHSGQPMHVDVCTELQSSGRFSREFRHLTVGKEDVTLGCAVDSGTTSQKFTVHWEDLDTFSTPSDITNPANDVYVESYDPKPGVGPWFLRSAHATKAITVYYTCGGRSRVETLEPLGVKPALCAPNGPAPPLTRVTFSGFPYPNIACNASGDKVPPIPPVRQ